jgi:hypothetical protein
LYPRKTVSNKFNNMYIILVIRGIGHGNGGFAAR